jgi:hypothetical protein
METDPRTSPAWNDPLFYRALGGAAAMLIGGRLANRGRFHNRLLLVACIVGAFYGYLTELDERRKGYLG